MQPVADLQLQPTRATPRGSGQGTREVAAPAMAEVTGGRPAAAAGPSSSVRIRTDTMARQLQPK
ncbi:hypothetical protein AAXB25_33495 [Paenibacillus lautus]|uniref:hypothetical protein n=1 Tax=Paenibacillus lautus TaxID=1401 RepID=UPI003D276772